MVPGPTQGCRAADAHTPGSRTDACGRPQYSVTSSLASASGRTRNGTKLGYCAFPVLLTLGLYATLTM